MFSRIALAGIGVYQRRISPHKGYRCAYSVAHGGTGCSGYAKHAIRDHGIWRAWPLIRQRFADCKAAHAMLVEKGRAKRKARAKARGRKRKEDEGWSIRDGCCLGLDFGMEGCWLLGRCAPALPAGRAAGSSKACDINPCDGDIGCGPCDVDICSCG